MSLTKSGAFYFYIHQTSGMCAGVCNCNCMHQKEKAGGMYFHLILVAILSIFILSVKNRGWGGGLLNEKKSIKHDKSYLLTVP